MRTVFLLGIFCVTPVSAKLTLEPLDSLKEEIVIRERDELTGIPGETYQTGDDRRFLSFPGEQTPTGTSFPAFCRWKAFTDSTGNPFGFK